MGSVDTSVEPFRETLATDVDVDDPPTASELSAGLSQIANIRAGGIVYITNSLPYGPPLEGGSSDQAPPGGILQASFEELVERFARVVDEVAA